MKLEGGCYCGKLRYATEGEPMMKAQCHCRECQYITGGAPNMFLLMPTNGFNYTKGTPKQFTRSDLERAVTREFCADCSTHIVTRRPGLPGRPQPAFSFFARTQCIPTCVRELCCGPVCLPWG